MSRVCSLEEVENKIAKICKVEVVTDHLNTYGGGIKRVVEGTNSYYDLGDKFDDCDFIIVRLASGYTLLTNNESGGGPSPGHVELMIQKTTTKVSSLSFFQMCWDRSSHRLYRKQSLITASNWTINEYNTIDGLQNVKGYKFIAES